MPTDQQNPLVGLLGGAPASPAQPLTPAPTDAETQAPTTSNPLATLLGNPSSTTPAPLAPTAAALSDSSALGTETRQPNPLEQIFKTQSISPVAGLTPEERAQSSRPDPENNVDEPWYSKTWDWMNKPLYDLHKWGTRTGAGTFERGVESGAEDLINGFISPTNLALMAATFGGSAVEELGVSGLRALTVSAKHAPIVARGIKALMGGYFTEQTIHGLVTQSPQFLDALKDGDVESASRLGVDILGGGAVAAMGMIHAAADLKLANEYRLGKDGNVSEMLATTKKADGELRKDKAISGDQNMKWGKALIAVMKKANVYTPEREAAIRRYLASDGDVSLMQAKHDALAGTLPVRPDTPGEDLVYHATDKVNADIIRNSGIKNAKQATAEYYNSAEEALKYSAQPLVGGRSNMSVFAVPRSEVEAGLAEAKLGGRTEARVEPVSETDPNTERIVTDKTHMPSHEIEMDAQGDPTGKTTALRPDSPHNITRDNARFEAKYTAKQKAALLQSYKDGQNLTPQELDITTAIRKFLDADFEKAHKNGLIRQWIEAYFPQIWATEGPTWMDKILGMKIDPAENPAFNALKYQTENGRFDTDVNYARQRAFETEFQGHMAGWKESPERLAVTLARRGMTTDGAIANRKFLETLRGITTQDGKPAAAMRGTSQVVGEDSNNPALFVNPDPIKQLAIPHETILDMAKPDPKTGRVKFDDLLARGDIAKLPWTREIKDPKTQEITQVPAYEWNAEGYQTIDHKDMRNYAYAGRDTAGNPVQLKGEMVVHPEIADYVKQVLGVDDDFLKNSPTARNLMTLQKEAKGGLLALSPFHAVQLTLRNAMIALGGITNEKARYNPFSVKPFSVEDEKILQDGVRNTLNLEDHRAEALASEGNVSQSKLIGMIPGVGKLQSEINRLTFDKIMPSMKAQAYKSVYYQLLDQMPGATPDEVAYAAARYTNDVFGGLNWRDLGISTNRQTLMRATMLAPDWLMSEVRMLYRAAGGFTETEGGASAALARSHMTKIAAAMFVTARIANMLTTGKPHVEAPFGLVTVDPTTGEEKTYNLRTLPTDLLHAVSDPRGFIQGRVNPLVVRTGYEALEGRNQFGQRVTGAQQVKDLAQNVTPIGLQGIYKNVTGQGSGGLTSADQVAKSFGVSVYKYRTEAEKLANEKASDRMPTGPVDAEHIAEHQQNIDFEDRIRKGVVSRAEILSKRSPRETDALYKTARMTPLQARFDRLPMNDAIDVWNIATPAEKDSLHNMLWKKRLNYIQNHTPAQRRKDPVWRKVQDVYADLNK